jgi:hypothetical protein
LRTLRWWRRRTTTSSEAVSIPAVPTTDVPAVPYAPSWLDRLLDAIEALPGPAALAYLALGGGLVALMYTEPWAGGGPTPWPPIQKIYFGTVIGAQLASAAYFRRVAGSAFDAFRPALPLPEPELSKLRYELTVIPARPALATTAAAIGLAALSLAVNPSATGNVPLTGGLLIAAFVLQSVVSAVGSVLLLQLVRQVRNIRRTVARSAVIDVFRPGPLHAFSRLTSQTAIAVALFLASSVVVLPVLSDPGALLVGWLPYLVLPPLVAAAAFFVPLYGMHGRLVAEKERLQGDAENRLQGVFSALNRDVDAGDVTRADALNKTLASMLQQRDVLARLPTWPWSAATLRGFVTAIFLPLVVFLLQRAASQVF